MASTLTDDKREVEVAWTPPMPRSIPSGAAVAALLAAMLGILALAVVNVLAEASEAFATTLHGIVSWLVLHPALRAREMNLARWLVIFLIGIGIATTLLWPPVYTSLAHH
jgi:hypothetical protein